MANILLGAGIAVLATCYIYWLAAISPSVHGGGGNGGTVAVEQWRGESASSVGVASAHGVFNSSQATLRFPKNLDDLTILAKLLTFYKERYFAYVLLLFCSAYLYKQCFAIPGSVFMNLLAGALFGVLYGFPLCCFLTACGASGCYLLSKHFGKDLAERMLRARLLPLQRKVEDHRDSLFSFLLFLRLFPMSPNWFLNIASPLVNVPLLYFFPSVLIGLMPYNFITVEAGSMLSSLTSVNDMFTLSTMLKMSAVALSVLVFILVKKRFAKSQLATDSSKLGLSAH
ncbi:hypothetical protein BOX15_Mlig018396g1 [Macrostomum lignano]|uniref:VTT domain-containing protein n=1 Tax=Macrostomum lignano TaxID=282301 RepID=A0A267H278_9PLAT|nr:hypothetical protein BOX15_Mlig018396g1 [Macrostomum lignano]